MQDYWQKQGSEPLFGDLLWSRPENRQHAGKLLIIGGHAHGFAAPAEAYQVAQTAGIGTAHVMLPDHIRPQLLKFQSVNLEMDFAPSTPSGSFASKALAELLAAGNWCDGALLAGDLGRNSETAIVLEKFVAKTRFPLTITKDAVDYFCSAPLSLLERKNVCLALSLAQLQKLATSLKFVTPITFGMDILHFVEALHTFTTEFPFHIITKKQDSIFVASHGKVSSTKTNLDVEDSWRVATATRAAVWWIQNQSKPFEALTTALHVSSD